MGTLVHLDGLTTAQALAVIARRFDALCALEIAMLAAQLASDGMSHGCIEVALERRRRNFAEWRRAQLAELEQWLAQGASKLH
jgi:hypothetical protein